MFKKENLSSLNLTNSNFCVPSLRLIATAFSSAEVSKRRDKKNCIREFPKTLHGLITFYSVFAIDKQKSFTNLGRHVQVRVKSR